MRDWCDWLESDKITGGIVWDQRLFNRHQQEMYRFGCKKCSEEWYWHLEVEICMCWYEGLLCSNRSEQCHHLESSVFDRTLASEAAKTGQTLWKSLGFGWRQRRSLIRKLPHRPSLHPKKQRQRPTLSHLIRRIIPLPSLTLTPRSTRPIQPQKIHNPLMIIRPSPNFIYISFIVINLHMATQSDFADLL